MVGSSVNSGVVGASVVSGVVDTSADSLEFGASVGSGVVSSSVEVGAACCVGEAVGVGVEGALVRIIPTSSELLLLSLSSSPSRLMDSFSIDFLT